MSGARTPACRSDTHVAASGLPKTGGVAKSEGRSLRGTSLAPQTFLHEYTVGRRRWWRTHPRKHNSQPTTEAQPVIWLSFLSLPGPPGSQHSCVSALGPTPLDRESSECRQECVRHSRPLHLRWLVASFVESGDAARKGACATRIQANPFSHNVTSEMSRLRPLQPVDQAGNVPSAKPVIDVHHRHVARAAIQHP